jgi:hypothetical protein
MIVRLLAALRPARPTSRERKPRQNRAWRFMLITLGSGVLAAVTAIGIAGVPTVLSLVIPAPTPVPINASALFPTVPALHKVVDVYDPAPKQAPQPKPVTPTANPAAAPRPTPSPRHSPRPTPPPDD